MRTKNLKTSGRSNWILFAETVYLHILPYMVEIESGKCF